MSTDEPRPPAIPHPDGSGRRPLKRNVFEAAQSATSQLTPIFPYLGDEAMVPAVVVFRTGYRGGTTAPIGHFHHSNSVDEVTVVLGGPAAGGARVGARAHPVGESPSERPEVDPDPDAYLIAVVTQRQEGAGTVQNEAILLRCSECRHLLLRHDFDVVPSDPDESGPAVFETLVQSYEAVRRFNSDDQVRICDKCGHVNEPFPIDRWGWDGYAIQTDVARRGRTDLQQRGASVLGAEGGPATR